MAEAIRRGASRALRRAGSTLHSLGDSLYGIVKDYKHAFDVDPSIRNSYSGKYESFRAFFSVKMNPDSPGYNSNVERAYAPKEKPVEQKVQTPREEPRPVAVVPTASGPAVATTQTNAQPQAQTQPRRQRVAPEGDPTFWRADRRAGRAVKSGVGYVVHAIDHASDVVSSYRARRRSEKNERDNIYVGVYRNFDNESLGYYTCLLSHYNLERSVVRGTREAIASGKLKPDQANPPAWFGHPPCAMAESAEAVGGRGSGEEGAPAQQETPTEGAGGMQVMVQSMFERSFGMFTGKLDEMSLSYKNEIQRDRESYRSELQKDRESFQKTLEGVLEKYAPKKDHNLEEIKKSLKSELTKDYESKLAEELKKHDSKFAGYLKSIGKYVDKSSKGLEGIVKSVDEISNYMKAAGKAYKAKSAAGKKTGPEYKRKAEGARAKKKTTATREKAKRVPEEKPAEVGKKAAEPQAPKAEAKPVAEIPGELKRYKPKTDDLKRKVKKRVAAGERVDAVVSDEFSKAFGRYKSLGVSQILALQQYLILSVSQEMNINISGGGSDDLADAIRRLADSVDNSTDATRDLKDYLEKRRRGA